jgi:hypothetical protein
MFLCGGRWVSVFNHSVLSKEIGTRKLRQNAANHRQEKAERGTSGAFPCPSAFGLLDEAASRRKNI